MKKHLPEQNIHGNKEPRDLGSGAPENTKTDLLVGYTTCSSQGYKCPDKSLESQHPDNPDIFFLIITSE
jgi:hypothetical protein